jgi:hypothetical protein
VSSARRGPSRRSISKNPKRLSIERSLAGDFKERVTGREIDLIARIEDGVPELEYLPASDGILVRGHRHLIAAPAKSGKSLTTLVHTLHMVQAGATVVVLDKENAQQLYALRLQAILTAWGESADLRRRIQKQFRYLEFPKLIKTDGPKLATWAKNVAADLVVFDSQRMFLTDLALNEDDADDYATFMAAAIDPLFEVGIATLILDNTGHNNDGRSRGSSAKRDLNELLFSLSSMQEFSEPQIGRVKLALPPGSSRLGNQGEWTMILGGGRYGQWRKLLTPGAIQLQDRPAKSGEKLILYYVRENEGCSKSNAIKMCKSKGIGDEALQHAVQTLTSSGELEARKIKEGNRNVTRLYLPKK